MKTLTTPVIGYYDTPVIACTVSESITPSLRTTTHPSFRAPTRNPAFKLLSRLIAVFGMLMMFLGSAMMADDPLDECGYFSGALSTRDACSGSGGVITFSGQANVYNNPDTALATCTVSTPQWVLDQTQTCESADCTAMPGNTKSASVTYNLAPAVAYLDASPSNSNTDKIVNADMTLPDYRYDAIDFNYAGEGKTLTFDQPSGFLSNPRTLVVNQITNAWKILFADNVDIEIGTITGATYTNPFELKTTATPSTIKIKSIDMKDNSQINLQASNSIEMETFSVGRGGSSVTLEAPTVTINELFVTNYGSGIATIHIKADTINLGTLDMGQGATVIVEPYTAGGKVTYKGNSITASSSSTMRVSSGDYYTDTLNLPGTSDASSFIAMDANSLVNLYINGDFAPGNNPGINSAGKDGNFGTLPSTTMRIFVNGDFNTGGGGTTINALMYVEGDVTLGNPSYVRGAISAKHSITVGEGAQIYYDSNISDETYAACPTVATSQDICYDTITYEGMMCMDMGVFQGGIGCKQTIPLRNVSGEPLSDVDAYIDTTGFSGGFLSDCGVDGASGNCEETSAIDLGPIDMFSSSIAYDVPNFDDNETHSIYEKALMSMSIFSGDNLYATYTKDGVKYVSEVRACSGSEGDDQPLIGNMDVIENTSYTTAGSYATADKNITTKIVNKPFDLEAVYLKNGSEVDYNGTIGNKTVNMAVMLYTSDTSTCNEEIELLWDGELAHNTSHVSTTSLLLSKAFKDHKIRAKFIDYGTLINNATNLNCSASSLDSSLCLVPACLNSDAQILKAFPVAQYPYVTTCLDGDGTGNAAPCDSNAYDGSCGGKKSSSIIGPSKYNNDIGCAMCLADALGMNGCSSDNFATRPNDFNSTISNNQLFTAGQATSLTFRADPFNAITGTVDYNETEHSSFVVDVNISDGSKTCQDMNISFSPDINFTNGTVTNGYTLNNVGDFNVTMHEIVGAEFAKVDENDTLLADRLITPHTQQIKVIPHHFDVNGTLSNGSTGFTYLHNNESNATLDQNISAILNILVVAKSALDTNTSNYAGNCYAKDGNSTLTFSFNPTITPAGSLNNGLWYDDVNNSNTGNSFAIGTIPTLNHPKERFFSGVGNLRYRLNFDRNVTKSVNPFMMTVTDVNVTDSNNVDGNNSIDNNATYVYGRVIARDVRIFGNKPFRANAWYEAFSTTPLSIGGAALAHSRTDTNWYIMAPHSDAQDGDANVTHIISTSNTTLPIGSTATTGVEIYNFAAETPPYSAKAHINTEAWLWYGINALDYADPSGANLDCFTHPCFNINVVPEVGATGSAKQDATDSKANKRTGGETGGTWKSTSDYAPAVR